MRFDCFEVERWMDLYECTPGILNVAETCAESVSIDQLIQLSEDKATNPLQTSTVLTYGAIRGSSTLRQRIASLYKGEHLSAESVLITQGAIAANFLVFYGLVGPGDHVICVYPTYQQLYSVPESLGAEVSLWRLQPENGFVPDVDELEALVKANTKMIVINNPNNPTGVPIPRDVVYEIVEFAKARGIMILSDEVYRPLFHDGIIEDNANMPPSVADLGYEKAIVTGSLSKAYSLAGIRVGWIASGDEAIIERLAEARHYTAISVSQLDDQVASYALSPAVRGPLLRRNVSLARRNAAMLAAFVEAHSSVCSWVAPSAGTTAFIRFHDTDGQPVDDVAFCRDVLDRTKVLIVPGSHCFGRGVDFAGYVRVGFVGSSAVLDEALQKLGEYVRQRFGL
ncbi:Aspartate/tyrosine/aromatic aminotransferase [Trichoderma reesei QM6a]|uniref:Aspartate/tyrosine/aromatic aminotransferase n=2 Tax=Hypocrea jecorina TaxID=51453 RepID=G0RKE3_HYPJQ|nr:Aspartate/tyrosine/aromatic aminotransferase [Trichoderma reesei QM6a]EGR48425.1 Aspartate/tyrosine/aromatic aminotransferase [Trichoderma reesei QM6a]ETS07061.1 aminotransferase class I and II [Trichoderma reesei RUT C-30]